MVKQYKKKKEVGGIILNPLCDFDCLFCDGHPKASPKEIKEQEIKAYKNLQEFRKKGINKISISGADPIEYDYLPELIKYIKKHFDFVRLATHGARLADKNFADKLLDAGLDELRMPIYGSKPEIHDSVTGKEGSFEKSTAGIKHILKKTDEVSFQFTSLIVKNNKEDLLDIADFVNSLGIKNKQHIFTVPCISDGNYSFYIPFKKAAPYFKKLYHQTEETHFLETPFCVFERIDRARIENQNLPPDLGEHNQPPEQHKTEIPDLPAYRKKRNPQMCKNCKAKDFCDGFFVNDIDKYGTGDLKPITKEGGVNQS